MAGDERRGSAVTLKCLSCGFGQLTWAQVRRQYARAIKRGLKPNEAKALMPRCGKCTTEMLQRAGTVGEIGEVGDSRSSPQLSDGLPITGKNDKTGARKEDPKSPTSPASSSCASTR
jgi:hypothetical protein